MAVNGNIGKIVQDPVIRQKTFLPVHDIYVGTFSTCCIIERERERETR